MRERGETDEKRGEHDGARCGQHVDHDTPFQRVVTFHSRGLDAGSICALAASHFSRSTLSTEIVGHPTKVECLEAINRRQAIEVTFQSGSRNR